MPLAIDLDLLDAIVEESMPWLQAWAMLLSLLIAAFVLRAARDFMRRRRSPVARFIRRAR